MTKSTITRERAQQIFLGNGPEPSASEERELARMALAAMDSSESVELPLDYLQGHKDGLEWAAQLAEANHPETGDWLYDDPIELSKAIRKGPDMPPAQPVADSKPVAIIDQANLDYLLSGADADVWPPEREEMGDVLLYRHAQPAPVVPDEKDKTVDADDHPLLWSFNEGWNACRADMLAAAPHDTPALNSVQSVVTAQGKWIPVSEQMPEIGDIVLTAMGGVVNVGEMECSAANYRFFTSVISGRELPATHWMPLPAAPQEVRGE
ncbi:DUF551 domain-containing protein [Klebsiella quasipneumoniae]|uniref:DUF551 domain-containing protein n=1 Tax=Klebsiella quasipneumoniae TaxID=1463165 RepID=UPI0034D3C493